MSRNDYDDMGPSFSRRSKGDNRKTYLISFMGVLIVLILILLYIVFRPVDGKDDAFEPGSSSSMELSIPSVESIPVERSTSFSVGEKNVSDKPFFSYYTVKGSDSLSSIAKAFGISEATISILNDIDDSTDLTEGLMLSIPQMDGLKYTVKEGDTLSLVLSEYPVSVDEEYVREINSISGELREGAEIFIPMSLSDDDISYTDMLDFWSYETEYYNNPFAFATNHKGEELSISGVNIYSISDRCVDVWINEDSFEYVTCYADTEELLKVNASKLCTVIGTIDVGKMGGDLILRDCVFIQ